VAFAVYEYGDDHHGDDHRGYGHHGYDDDDDDHYGDVYYGLGLHGSDYHDDHDDDHHHVETIYYRPKKKRVYVPVFVRKKEKKKSRIKHSNIYLLTFIAFSLERSFCLEKWRHCLSSIRLNFKRHLKHYYFSHTSIPSAFEVILWLVYTDNNLSPSLSSSATK